MNQSLLQNLVLPGRNIVKIHSDFLPGVASGDTLKVRISKNCEQEYFLAEVSKCEGVFLFDFLAQRCPDEQGEYDFEIVDLNGFAIYRFKIIVSLSLSNFL